MRFGVDAYLVAAVMDRESLCGEALSPKGPEGTGDSGNGLGLMQIDRRHHGDFVAELLPNGLPAWTDASRNIEYGTRLLRDNILAFNGNEALAVGAYNAGVAGIRRALRKAGLPSEYEAQQAVADSVTTGGNYVTDVFGRRKRFRRIHQTARGIA